MRSLRTSRTRRQRAYNISHIRYNREAVEQVEAAALSVRSDNYSAIKAFEKTSHCIVGEKLWIDVGTGIKPQCPSK